MKKNSPKRVECSLYKSIRKTVFLIMLTLLSTLSALAQERSISGAVIDEKGEPLIGVSVSIKGTTTGTLTDIDGKFKLNAASLSYPFHIWDIQQKKYLSEINQ